MHATIAKDDALRQLAHNLNTIAIRRGLSQSEIARRLFGDAEPASRMKIYRWFNGLTSAAPDDLLNLADVLRCPVGDLLRPQKNLPKS